MPSNQNGQIIIDDIPIHIQRKKHIKRLSIKVHPYQGVVLNAPLYMSIRIIETFLAAAGPWIRKHYQLIEPLYFQQGEKHAFLGVDYPLNLIICHSKSDVVLDNHQFNIYSQRFDSQIVKEQLHGFYQRQAHMLFPSRVLGCMQLTPWVKSMPKLKYRFMTSRYGSCSSLGNISLNIHLIKARTELIDYVILHELCHIQEHHHGPQFYQLMEEVMPNWRSLKAELKRLIF